MSTCATYPSPPLNPLCRAFNLEALITNAKLGAQLGVDYYNFPSKYGRTIQDAVNFAMNVKPGKEDVEELLPHVAAVAAAYAALRQHTPPAIQASSPRAPRTSLPSSALDQVCG